MRLRELHVHALPGIDTPFSLTGLADGIHVLVGPNASGKSSVVRALRALLYREEARGRAVHLEATFDDAGERLRVTRTGDAIGWERAGRRAERPALPDHHRLGAYLLRIEDLVRPGDLDATIADRLATELAGGFDLRAARRSFEARAGMAEKRALDEAKEAASAARVDRDALESERARLRDLARDRDEAGARAARAPAIEVALKLVAARRERAELDRRLAAFPPGLERLRGNEPEQAARAARAAADARDAAREADRALRRARDELASTGLDADEPTHADVRELQARATTLGAVEVRLREAREAAAAAQARATRLLGDGDAAPSADPDPRPATLRALSWRLQARDAAAAVEARARERLDDARHEAEPVDDPEGLELPRQLLATWAASPDPALVRPPRPGAPALHAVALLLAGGAAAAAASAGALAAPAPLALLLASVAVFAAALALGRPRVPPDADARERTRREYAACGAEPPTAWTTGAVRSRYEEFTREAIVRQEARAREARNQHRRRRLEAELEEAAAERRRAQARLEAACAEAGLPPERVDTNSVDRLAWASDLRAARAEAAARAATADDLAREREARRDALLGALRATGDAPRSGDADADALRVRLDALAHRVHARDAARAAIASAEAARARADDDAAEARVARLALARGGGLELADDADEDELAFAEAELRERVARLPDLQDLQRRRARLEGAIEGDEARLAPHPPLRALVDADDEAALRTERDAAAAAETERDRLQRRVTEIETRIRAAEHDRRVERTRLEATRARDALETVYEDALSAEAGHVLLDLVEARQRTVHQPATLERARGWFGRFTGHAFALEFDPGRPPAERLFARDLAADRECPPDELSSGTKAQLLLALRIAHAIEGEAGRASLPLVLDEALTTTDAERFGRVAGALATLAREEGRQIFYLSARRADVELWTSLVDGPVRVVDVAEARGRGRDAPAADAYRAEPPAVVPDPDGASPEVFAARLGVPPVDPWAPSAIHPFHLLRDDLPLVAALARLRIVSAGPLRSLLEDAPRAAMPVDEARRAIVRARLLGAEAWCRAWRVGRGRPLGAAALRDLVGDTFGEEVAVVAAAAGGDARDLIARLEAGAVSGFGPKRTAALAASLRDEGHLDARSVASAGDLTVTVAAALRDALGAAAPDEAERLARWLAAGVRASEGTADGRPAGDSRRRGAASR